MAQTLSWLREEQGRPEHTELLHAALDALNRGEEEAPESGDGASSPSASTGALDPLRVACATFLDERGERARALALVRPLRSVAGMMVAAELLAADGQLARAVGTLERVLARDIETPGARERHARYRAQLGGHVVDVTGRGDAADQVTVVAPEFGPETSFRLLREVARGGAGTVYLAEDEHLGRRLAFKVYHRAGAEAAVDEARTAVRLRGPGVVRVFDADPAESWLAMEWVPAGSLRDRLKAGRVGTLPPLRAWLGTLAEVIARIHDEGLVHGDLKPANLLFDAGDALVVTDFGTCVATGKPPRGGTPGYMSPERLGGAPADPRDDVYAFGRILEDVLGAREDAGARPVEPDLAPLAVACLAPAEERPSGGHALREALRRLAPAA
ncbi:MAG: serine/threonine-protein kinase [Myxococcota bacterium]